MRPGPLGRGSLSGWDPGRGAALAWAREGVGRRQAPAARLRSSFGTVWLAAHSCFGLLPWFFSSPSGLEQNVRVERDLERPLSTIPTPNLSPQASWLLYTLSAVLEMSFHFMFQFAHLCGVGRIL
ncbi:uncharacterized protein LOC131384313 [Hylobates moloch]|uniref:uncharacterized protein LOC131384313 n=1 Tax=Hylobates moloch TaxID=81572 RepID=UPI0026761B64|nr:uncharacterized protein LOC131384313 [Hylobates moloch]